MTDIKHLFTYGLAFGDSWLYVVVILASAIYGLRVIKHKDTGATGLRLLSGIGFLATDAGIFLGGIWPSYFTLVAILILPAPFVFAFAAVRPPAVWKRAKLRMYLNLCVVASGLMWVAQLLWELRASRVCALLRHLTGSAMLNDLFNTTRGFTAVLIACVGLLTIFPWQPILLRRPTSRESFRPVLLLTLSSLLQVTFILLVGGNVLTLDYSVRFAALGLPLCILALVLAGRRKQEPDLPRGTVTCVILSLVMWMFLITVH